MTISLDYAHVGICVLLNPVRYVPNKAIAMTAADYAILGILVGLPVMIVWFALSKREF
jgi:hypothetical protein